MFTNLTQAEVDSIFDMDELSGQIDPGKVEAYGIKDGGTVYIYRMHNKDGGLVPALDAYIVATWPDGEKTWIRANDPAEITLWTKHLQ